MIYAGIGARKTPPEVLDMMRQGAFSLAGMGLTLRSGGAAGADTAFEQGASEAHGTKEIYLPWKGFNRNTSQLYGTTLEARQMAKEFHPKWEILGNAARDFMGRNVYQILGKDMNTPSDFVLCWTPDGKVTGGTGQALRMAAHFKIPVFNFGSMTPTEITDEIEKLLKEKSDEN